MRAYTFFQPVGKLMQIIERSLRIALGSRVKSRALALSHPSHLHKITHVGKKSLIAEQDLQLTTALCANNFIPLHKCVDTVARLKNTMGHQTDLQYNTIGHQHFERTVSTDLNRNTMGWDTYPAHDMSFYLERRKWPPSARA